LPPDSALTDRTNCLFMGTHIVRGSAEAVVVVVGGATEFEHTARRLEQQIQADVVRSSTSAFGALLLRVMDVLVTLIFAINSALGGSTPSASGCVRLYGASPSSAW
jgi:Mg2+-importing ATPase